MILNLLKCPHLIGISLKVSSIEKDVQRTLQCDTWTGSVGVFHSWQNTPGCIGVELAALCNERTLKIRQIPLKSTMTVSSIHGKTHLAASTQCWTSCIGVELAAQCNEHIIQKFKKSFEINNYCVFPWMANTPVSSLRLLQKHVWSAQHRADR